MEIRTLKLIVFLLGVMGVMLWSTYAPREEDYASKEDILLANEKGVELPWQGAIQPLKEDRRLRIKLEMEGMCIATVHVVDAHGKKSKLLRVYNGGGRSNWTGVLRVHHLDMPLILELTGKGRVIRVVGQSLRADFFIHRDGHRWSVVLGGLLLLWAGFLLARSDWGSVSTWQVFYWAVLPLILIGVLGVGLWMRYESSSGFSRLICMGYVLENRATDRYLSLKIPTYSYFGYDGGQYAQIALDPFDLDRPNLQEALDNPSYRYRRIGLPFMAWVLGLGQITWVWQVYAVLNVLFWLGLLGLLYLLLKKPDFLNAGAIIGIMLSAGTIESVRLALVDLPAACLGGAAIAMCQQRRQVAGSIVLGYACLTRETALAFLPAICGRYQWQGKWSSLVLQWLPWVVMLTIYLGWFLYVRTHYLSYTNAVSVNIGWPATGWWECWKMITETGGVGVTLNYYCLLAWMGLGIQSVYLLKRWDWSNPWWRMGVMFAPLYVCLQLPVWENYFAVTRAVLPLTIGFNLLLATRREKNFWVWWVTGNFYSWHGLYRWMFTAN
jgi:hypothetical protein